MFWGQGPDAFNWIRADDGVKNIKVFFGKWLKILLEEMEETGRE